MLNKIYDFAIKKELTPNENFTLKHISAYILLNKDGEYCGLETKPKKDKSQTPCPDIGSLSFSPKHANPIVEKRKFILDKNEDKHKPFLEIMQNLSENSSIVQVVSNYLNFIENNEVELIKLNNELDELKIKTDDFISFKVETTAVEDDNSWKNSFNQLMKTKKSTVQAEMFKSCITGLDVSPITNSSPLIKQPGSIVGKGVYVSSYGNASFKSYGCTDNLNAPIGEEEAKIIKEGIEYLLSSSQYFNKNFGIIHFCDYEQNILPLQGLIGFSDFEDEEETTEIDNSNIIDKKDIVLKNNLEIPYEGGAINEEIENDIFHILEFKVPTDGRFFIPKYKKGNCKDLHQNIKNWKEDTSLITVVKKDDKYIQTTKSINKLFQVFFKLVENKKSDDKFKQINNEFGIDKTNLLYSIIDDTQIPIRIYQKAIRNYRHSFYIKPETALEEIEKRQTMFVSLQIIKAYLIRKDKKEGKTIIMPELNKNEKNLAYNCGRLFAIYEQIQYRAQGNLNASIVDNYFVSAQSNPHLVFGRLAKLSNYHLNKIGNNGSKIYWTKKIQEITDNIDAFPKSLNIEEQGRFALGYYHQKSEIFKTNNEKENNNE